MQKLCEHWAEHNESHKESFAKWRDFAKNKGLISVVDNLNSAIKMMEKCNEFLLSASHELTTVNL